MFYENIRPIIFYHSIPTPSRKYTHYGAKAYGIETDYFDALYSNFIIKYNGNDKVEFAGATEKFKESCRINAEWYQKGYMLPDILTADEGDYNTKNMMNDVSFVWCVNNGMGDEETISATISANYGFDVVAIPVRENYYIGRSWGAGGNGITAKCEHPEEAIRLLELINTEEGMDLYNMLVYGLEGTHYTKNADGTIKTLYYDGSQAGSDAPYGAMKWIMGNTFHAYLNQGCAVGENELSLAINENPNNVISDLIGFVLDTSKIETQLEQIQAVVTEYEGTLRAGAKGADWESYYNEYIDKVNKAGLDEVLTEIQAQVDAFNASK